MNNLKEFLQESLFQKYDSKDIEIATLPEQFKSFLKDNYLFYYSQYDITKSIDNTNIKGFYKLSDDEFNNLLRNNFKFSYKGKQLIVDTDLSLKLSCSSSSTKVANKSFIWGTVEGDFVIGEYTKSLEGAPEVVGGNYVCSYSLIPSLKGGPKIVRGNFECIRCKKLTSLEGSPKEVDGDVLLGNLRKIKDLRGLPKEIEGNFECSYCTLDSFKGCPEIIHGDCVMGENSFSDPTYFPKEIYGNLVWNQAMEIKNIYTDVKKDIYLGVIARYNADKKGDEYYGDIPKSKIKSYKEYNNPNYKPRLEIM